jgi:hypothetical protein
MPVVCPAVGSHEHRSQGDGRVPPAGVPRGAEPGFDASVAAPEGESLATARAPSRRLSLGRLALNNRHTRCQCVVLVIGQQASRAHRGFLATATDTLYAAPLRHTLTERSPRTRRGRRDPRCLDGKRSRLRVAALGDPAGRRADFPTGTTLKPTYATSCLGPRNDDVAD